MSTNKNRFEYFGDIEQLYLYLLILVSPDIPKRSKQSGIRTSRWHFGTTLHMLQVQRPFVSFVKAATPIANRGKIL